MCPASGCAGEGGWVEATIAEVDAFGLGGEEPPLTLPLHLFVFDAETGEPVRDQVTRLTSGYREIGLHLPGSDVEPSHFMQTWTDEQGTVDVDVVIEGMPVDPETGEAQQSSVVVDVGVDQMVVEIQPW